MSAPNSSNLSGLQASTALLRPMEQQRIPSSEYSGYLVEDEAEDMMYESDLEYDQDDAYDDEDDEFDEEGEAVESDEEEAVEATRTVQAPTTTSVADAKSKEQAEQHQVDLRKQIVLIQQDSKMTPQEKAKKIQELMTSKWTSRDKGKSTRACLASNRLADKREDFNHIHQADRQLTFHDQTSGVVGCKHYQRSAKLQAHCCGKWYTCRFCHDEVSDHNIIRNLITTMMCMHCSTVQAAAQDCINPNCQKRVSKYYCKECKLWDDDPRKNIYHCYDCGICRIGKGLGQDYFHCKKCNVCMAISLKGRHKCIERNLESDCPICGEYMFTSTTTVIFMPCGHCIHFKCHQEYIQTSYQCPTCFKSLANMTEYFKRIDAMLSHHQMPPEYSKTQTYIYCNDCEKKCYAKFHFLYHKCVHCKGYNTKVLQTSEVTDGTTVEANNAKLITAAVTPVVETKEVANVSSCCQVPSVSTAPVSNLTTALQQSSRSSSSTSNGQSFGLTVSEPLFPNSSSSLHFSSALSSRIAFGTHAQPSQNAQVALNSHIYHQHSHANHTNQNHNHLPHPQQQHQQHQHQHQHQHQPHQHQHQHQQNQHQHHQYQHQHPITSHPRLAFSSATPNLVPETNQYSLSSLPGLPNSSNYSTGPFDSSSTRPSSGYGVAQNGSAHFPYGQHQ
ncbi:hypothetical protein CcCBS67573_g06316 [Chytriomyces confervae]|uniref:RING-type domain-containing protein n=1 Tax=Chytriomyces confervae TaxID=246404 RepID=A0A507F4H9_9FUNG|nr:hypothetical protein CcCBS67573_g06316 [Chytriomyces confervae]